MRKIVVALMCVSILGLAACESTRDRRLSAADQVLGVASSHECRAVRAVSLTRAVSTLWTEQDWTAATEAAQMMVDHSSVPEESFNVLADNFAYSFYTPLIERAVASGINLASDSTNPVAAARTILKVVDLIQRMPRAAIVVGKVRADVARCVATKEIAAPSEE